MKVLLLGFGVSKLKVIGLSKLLLVTYIMGHSWGTMQACLDKRDLNLAVKYLLNDCCILNQKQKQKQKPFSASDC